MGTQQGDDETDITGPPDRPLSRKRRQTRERLLSAALDAFAERGFHASSVEDICERAGMTRGGFYGNFASKEELFLALYEQQTAHLLDAISTPPQAKDTAMQEYVPAFLGMIPQDLRWHLVNSEFALHALRDPAAAAVLVEATTRLRARMSSRIDDVLTAAGLRLTVPTDTVVRWLFAVRNGGLTQAYLEPDLLRPNELPDQLAQLLLVVATRAADHS
ncbi:TetR/AcrR family transcriptional regulator [Nocardia sp. NPDC046473]|uniref:TetR/AcrR family transcriptional regulator n=1 Tax=Nocardia sp. NPDC046473 TaxID=3155733 RepID=UPI0033E655E3